MEGSAVAPAMYGRDGTGFILISQTQNPETSEHAVHGHLRAGKRADTIVCVHSSTQQRVRPVDRN